jgi:hypothetical protein
MTTDLTTETHGVPAGELSDEDLRRDVRRLHETRHETMLNGTEDAFEAHTRRMLGLEQEFLRRFAADSAPDPARTRAGSRDQAGQEVPGRDVGIG